MQPDEVSPPRRGRNLTVDRYGGVLVARSGSGHEIRSVFVGGVRHVNDGLWLATQRDRRGAHKITANRADRYPSARRARLHFDGLRAAMDHCHAGRQGDGQENEGEAVADVQGSSHRLDHIKEALSLGGLAQSAASRAGSAVGQGISLRNVINVIYEASKASIKQIRNTPRPGPARGLSAVGVPANLGLGRANGGVRPGRWGRDRPRRARDGRASRHSPGRGIPAAARPSRVACRECRRRPAVPHRRAASPASVSIRSPRSTR